jgi:hypothetical protein
MSLMTRGRVPGPVGAPGGSSRASPRLHYVPHGSSPGPLGVGAFGQVVRADAGSPESDVVSDENPGASTVELIEPEPVFGQSAALQNVNVPLFAGEQNVPVPEDVVQGALNNCPVAAILAALAHVAPETVSGMIARRSADVRSRRRSDPPDSFPYRTDRLYTVQFLGGHPVQVSSFLYYTGGVIAYAHSPENRAAWMSYIEKAYAVFRGGSSYNRLNTTTQLGQAPSLNQVMEDLAGPYDFADLAENLMYRHNSDSAALTDADVRQMLAQADQRVTVAGSRDAGIPESVVSNHAYTVLDQRRNTVYLRNPQGGPDAAVTFSFNEFKTIFRAVLQASQGS